MLAQSTERRWHRAVQHERSLRVQLQENIETLASEMHGLEARCQETSGASVSASNHKAGAQLMTDMTSINQPLPGKPLLLSRVGSEGIMKKLPPESDSDSVASSMVGVVESTDGGLISTTAIVTEEDEDSEFFDALDQSVRPSPADTPKHLRPKDEDSMASSSISSISPPSSKPTESSTTVDDHLPGPEQIDRHVNVSLSLSIVILLAYIAYRALGLPLTASWQLFSQQLLIVG